MKRHWRWYTRNKSRHADRAVAEVISTILSVSIVLTVAATIMFWGIFLEINNIL